MEPSETNIHVVILAAGASSRLGRPKHRARAAGVPMLQRVVSQAQAFAGPAVTVVLGEDAADIVQGLSRSSAAIVIDRGWDEGIASSIRAGIKSLPSHCEAALLMFADQSGVTSSDLQRLADRWRRNDLSIAAAWYGGGCGVPAILPRSRFPALMALRGEQGPETLLRNPKSNVLAVPMPSAAPDIDAPADLTQP